MSTIERAAHPSRAQIDALLEFLEKNSSLAKGFSKVPSARDAARKNWERLALMLNSLGGCIKTSKQWIKYWADKKSSVKKKGALRFRTKNKTGGGAEVVQLSVPEERILALMGGDGFAIGDRHLEINPFEEAAQNSNPSVLISAHHQPPTTVHNTPNIFTSEVSDTEYYIETIQSPGHVIETSQSSQARHCNFNLEYAQSSSFESPSLLASHLSSVPPQSSANNQNNVQTEQHESIIEVSRSPPQTRNEDVMPTTPSGSGTHPRRHARIVRRRLVDSPTNSTSGGRRHRRRRPVSPPSQRRSHLTGLTERFMRLEESRLEVDRSTVRALEAIGEGLKLLVEVFKNK